jgi:hypothetical protein
MGYFKKFDQITIRIKFRVKWDIILVKKWLINKNWWVGAERRKFGLLGFKLRLF